MIKRLLIIFFLALSVSASVAGWFWFRYQQVLHASVVQDQELLFEISRGESLSKIIRNLQLTQVSVDPLWFKFIAYRMQAAHSLKAGEYRLLRGMTTADLLNLFVAGKTTQYALTIPEGWNIHQVLRSLRDNRHLKQTLKDVRPDDLLEHLGYQKRHPEGMFFPETYFFEKHTPDVTLLRRAYEKMQQVLQEEWVRRQPDLPLDSAYQALILASIIEKETAVSAEREQIAGVFVRRLRQGMLLQTDPTVIYGLGERFDGDIKTRDLREPTPYNTYVVSGLPPTPIAMPGQPSIHAALHPAAGKSLYFVAKGDGTHVFSNTLREHNKAVARMLKNRR